MNDQQREALRRALNALKAAQRGDLDSQWNREAIADVEAALTQPRAQQAIKQDLTTEQQAAAVPAGFKLIKDSTREERSWPEDYELDNGRYFNTCCNCERLFLGHKRRIECKACATAAPPAPVLPLSDDYLTIRVKHEEGSYLVTVDQEPGIAIAHQSLAVCLSDVSPSVQRIRELNGITAHGAGGEPT